MASSSTSIVCSKRMAFIVLSLNCTPLPSEREYGVRIAEGVPTIGSYKKSPKDQNTKRLGRLAESAEDPLLGNCSLNWDFWPGPRRVRLGLSQALR